MTPDDLDPLEQHLLAALGDARARGDRLSDRASADAVWRAQVESRHCDFAARWLQKDGRSFYTIGSAGHESNAVVALALRADRPGAPPLPLGRVLPRPGGAGRPGRRAGRACSASPPRADEPIAGGRHKVFGHHDLAVIPQTSTIASHLPRAVGVAIAIDRARKLGVDGAWPRDAVVVCSFGDASLNHATAQARSTRPRTPRTSAFPCPCSSSARTTASGSASRRPPGGWARTLASRTDDPLRGRRRRRSGGRARTSRASSPTGCARPGGRLCSTSAPCATSATRAPTSRPPTARPADVRADLDRTRSSQPAALARPHRSAHRRRARRRSTSSAGQRVREVALAAARRPQLESAGRGDARRSRRARPRRRRARPPRWPRREPRPEPLTLALAINGALADALQAPPRGAAVRRGRRREGRRVRRHRAGSMRGSAPAVSSTRCSTRPRSSASPSAPRSAGSSRCPRSSTSPTSTTPRTSSVARPRRCSSSPRARYRNGMVVRIAGLRLPEGLRRALPQRRLGRGAPRHPRPRDRVAGAAGRCGRQCCAPASRRRRSTAASARSSSRSRSTTPATCYEEGDGLWLAHADATSTCRSARPAPTATVAT